MCLAAVWLCETVGRAELLGVSVHQVVGCLEACLLPPGECVGDLMAAVMAMSYFRQCVWWFSCVCTMAGLRTRSLASQAAE